MTTVKQLIKHLQTLPQEAIVQVRNDNGKYIKLELDKHVYLIDCRGRPNIKEDNALFNTVWLELGE